MEIRVTRLTSNDRDGARRLFRVMAEIFTEECAPLSDGYLDQLLRCKEFWALAAFADDDIIGGVTAHTLPMTRTESSEVFIYDIAVESGYRRKGVGRRLLKALCEQAAELGIEQVFVSVDNGDAHALDFYRSLGGKPSPVTIFSFSHLNISRIALPH
jgi:aminoglycoside 3-N-acetyltransferase I